MQHKIKENCEFLWNLINNKSAYIFIAGNSKDMPDCVKTSFVEIFENQGNMNSEDAKNFLKKLEISKRFQLETW